MSPDRQPRRFDGTAPLPAGLAVDLSPSEGFDLHTHRRHQLALAAHGVLVMSGRGRSWVLPRTRALWIPAGIPHAVAVSGRTTMLSTYVDPARCPLAWDRPTVVDASGLLGELVAHL